MTKAHEIYVPGQKAEKAGRVEERRDFEKEQRLQFSWFQHRAQARLEGGEMERELQRIATESPDQAENITQADVQMKKDIIIADIIGSPMGSAEAEWFRLHFPNDRSAPLAPQYQVVLEKFEADPSFAHTELDRLFRESVTLH